MTERKYALDLLKEIGFLLGKPAATPIETTVKLSSGDSELLADNCEYRSIDGKLLYFTITRHDLSFSLQKLSEFLDRPTMVYWKAMHNILRYIKSALGQGLLFRENNDTNRASFNDS